DAVLEDYGYGDLSDRLDLLATLYHDRGDLDRAISTLLESEELCKKHGVEFDGEDILREYLEEKGRAGADWYSQGAPKNQLVSTLSTNTSIPESKPITPSTRSRVTYVRVLDAPLVGASA